ncbi:transglutaminaseTgpA domain-containing protein [Pontibacterium sp.]|uniref:transglutaminaseTgpA domain-containing protein n=1 Tax=Pontibacterium sp. TaxID=2036026 RepID=UPI0035638442
MRQYFGDRTQRLCLGLWFLALLPAIHHLAWVHLLLCLVPIALYQPMRLRPSVRWAMMGMVLLIAIGWIVLSGQPWLSAQTITGVLALVLLLKWAESRTARELRLSAMASLVLATLSSLYLSGLLALAYLVSCGIVVLFCLQAINDSEHQLSHRQLLKTTLNLSVLALPVTLLLFVTVPRIQGPLWDIGLAIGLPIELAINQDARGIGLKATLKAGQVSRLKRSDAPVLVAEFSGAVPYKSRLYWRGPVFSDYDGISWNLPENWNNRGRLLRDSLRGPDAVLNVLTSKRDRVHYEARVSPHSGRWLYSLDLPTGQTPEAFISGDFQLLGIRKISREFKYDVDAWLEYSGGKPLSAEQRSAYLQYPTDSNPKLRAFGQQLAQSSPDPQDILHQWRKTLVTGGYQLTEITDIDSARDNLDTFFFDRKTGAADRVYLIWLGSLAALGASVLTAIALHKLIQNSGAARETLEGVTMLIAAVLLSYVSVWLFARREMQQWQGFIQDRLGSAVSGGSLWAIVSVAFFAVYREGAETILFYQALVGDAEGQWHAIATGFGLAVVALLIVYLLIFQLSVRLPLKHFFTGTAALLYALSVIFTGKAVLELQVAGWLGNSYLPSVPTISWLGLFPSLQSVLSQLAMILLPVLGWLLIRLRSSQVSHIDTEVTSRPI